MSVGRHDFLIETAPESGALAVTEIVAVGDSPPIRTANKLHLTADTWRGLIEAIRQALPSVSVEAEVLRP